MSAARRVWLDCVALALTLPSVWVAPALAQGPAAQPRAQEDRPRRRTPQAPPAPPATDTAAGVTSRKPTKPVGPRALPPPVLSSAVRSRYSPPAVIARSTAGQCRARCAEARGQCFNADSVDTSGCDPGWTQCLSSCEGLTYSRGP